MAFLLLGALAIGLVAYRLIMPTSVPQVREIQGKVGAIIDGDTFDVCAADSCQRIRLCGIDAPERGQAGYEASRDALNLIVQHETVRCTQVGLGTVCDNRSKPTNRSRMVAQCFIGELDIAAEMVRSGHACDWPRYSGGAYATHPGACVRN